MDRMKAPPGVFDDEDYGPGGDGGSDEDQEDGGSGDLPPDFRAHAEVALDENAEPNDRVQALYDAIMCCSGGEEPHGKGLDVIIGLGKSKGKR